MKDKRSAEDAMISWREERSLLAGEDFTGGQALELSMKDSKDWLQFYSETPINLSSPTEKFCTLRRGKLCLPKRKTLIICYLAKGQVQHGQESLHQQIGKHPICLPSRQILGA